MSTTAHFDLTGRTALITGASSGLGVQFAKTLSKAGAKVVLAARRIDRLAELKAELEAAGARALAVEMDVTDEASVQAGYAAAEAAFGPVDTVIANAGMNSEGSVLKLPVAEFDALMAVNLRGVFLTAREGAARMIAADSATTGRGRIILVSSITAHAVTGMLAAYSASKAAVIQLGKVMALEWSRRGVNVNSICPGYIATELNSDWFGTEGGQKQINTWPRRRLMNADSLDAMVLYLASDASAAITGSSFSLDDGQSL